MATKTLILRPTSVTSNDETLVTLYPISTTMAEAHVLVSEATADDDSTYIVSKLGSVVHYHFAFTKPADFKNASNFNFNVRYKSEGGATTGTAYTLNFGTDSGYSIGSTGTTNQASYIDIAGTITTTDAEAIIAKFNDTSSDLTFYITQSTATGASKNKPIRTTQIYVEISYEDISSQEALSYFKSNGEWINLGVYNAYYKKNNKWTSLKASDLDPYSSKKYKIEVIE